MGRCDLEAGFPESFPPRSVHLLKACFLQKSAVSGEIFQDLGWPFWLKPVSHQSWSDRLAMQWDWQSRNSGCHLFCNAFSALPSNTNKHGMPLTCPCQTVLAFQSACVQRAFSSIKCGTWSSSQNPSNGGWTLVGCHLTSRKTQDCHHP